MPDNFVVAEGFWRNLHLRSLGMPVGEVLGLIRRQRTIQAAATSLAKTLARDGRASNEAHGESLQVPAPIGPLGSIPKGQRLYRVACRNISRQAPAMISSSVCASASDRKQPTSEP